ncbi:glycosyl hydrolase 53 [Choiromyces venosus 120613-1]|uniref:Arabinogalactan endo-beta-1,4-galactanase n=1 Tax=Choiromyces venosus 120613-1 TaxID=1336337 RepID=A0A3N4JQE5_9PEZI|nr:glycosyl hydrolase 53 [Choiromyces venosus 120613-1]
MLSFLPKLLLFSVLFQSALAALTWKTFDISSLLLEESKKVSYRDVNGDAKPLETIIKENGANSIKIRIWVNPADGVYNLDYALTLGARAKAAGLGVVLNLHYSDSWTDPGHQTTPAAWASLGIDALVAQVRTYTTNVMNAFAGQGITVQLVSIGNEIRAGFLWPLGKYDNFANMGRLLTAGIQGVKSSRSSSTLTMIHLDEGYSWSTQKWFYDTLAASGTFSMSSFDIQGVSYYPFWSATGSTLENFQTTVNNMASTYQKRIVVMETDWPVRCNNPSQIPTSLTSAFPFSAAGQSSWAARVATIVKAIPNSLGAGVMYWEPGWIDNQVLGSPCDDNVLFDGDWSNANAVVARARSSINMMAAI